jgi:hypothetical protein
MKVRQKLLIAGGIAGALVGVAAAFLYIKANEPRIDADEVKKVSPGEALTIGLALLGVVRQIANLGQD